MKAETFNRSPQVLVPYPGPSCEPGVQDVFLYLRPEANGVEIESTILRVIEHCPEYRRNIFLVYLANVPGGFILERHVVERYYQVQLAFAVHGKSLFTPAMRSEFSRWFGEPFESAPVIGAFEALRVFKMRPEELFDVWVDEAELLTLRGQTVKRYRGRYIVNYDVPALLHKNNRSTDIAAMVFRLNLGWDYFATLAEQMEAALAERGFLEHKRHVRRLFHYSRGPFQEIVDGCCYLCGVDGELLGLEQTSFGCYLLSNGMHEQDLRRLLTHPIALFEGEDGELRERNIFQHTAGDSYPEALAKLRGIRAQYLR